MAKIRKLNVSEIAGRSPFNNDNDAVMPAGTIVIYEKNINGIIEYVLRVHDGVTDGGVPFPNAPSIIHNNDVNVTINSGDSSSYTWNFGQTGDLTAPGDLIPAVDNNQYLGSVDKRWHTLYVGPGTIDVDGLTISKDADGNINFGGTAANKGISFKDSTTTNIYGASIDNIYTVTYSADEHWFQGPINRGDVVWIDTLNDLDGVGTAGHIYSGQNQNLIIDGGYEDPSGAGANLYLRGQQIEIRANVGGNGIQSKNWVFTDDGNLTLPEDGDILDSTGASVLGGGGGSDFTTNIDGSKTLTISNETTTTQTVYAYNYPNSGADFVLKAPGNQFRIQDSNDSVNVSIFANGSTVTFTSYTLLLTSDMVWDGTNWNADCTVTSGGSVSEDIILYGYMMGSVVVTSTTSSEHEYTFGGDGSLTFPDGTVQTTAPESFSFSVAADDSTQRAISNNELVKFIGAGGVTTSSDAEGNITITGNKVVGEWAVTTGTNTYTFTLPSDGTYAMWVKGNIPNGIIVWNATASVSNTNVPAIGFQYAWNYTGGGSPIALTSIPDQIRGTAGTISTDATYTGTTSNRFDFGISNSSGSTQTIYYGYTKIS
jgi:hypothetical protein